MSVAAAPVDLLDVPGSAPPPSVGKAAAWPQAVVRLQAAVHREVVVLHQAPTQALRTLRTLHPAWGGAPVEHVPAPVDVPHVQVVAHCRLHVAPLAERTVELLGLGGVAEGRRGEEVLGNRSGPRSGSGGLGRRRSSGKNFCPFWIALPRLSGV
ncbi:hypothetical protein TYRP_001530 [Tyrophagus putrescentiae]|nr:hypothetical protein TYRP_001530 [Tyrophagus putrescentiae]